MSTRRIPSKAGLHVYGFAAMALGVVGLIWGDFAANWQPIQAFGDVPHRRALAYIAAVLLLVGGAGMQWGRTAQAGALMVTTINFLFAVFWLPRVIGFPRIFGTWGGFFEAFCPVAAGAILYATLSATHSAWASRTAQAARYLFGIFAISFGIEHFLYVRETAAMVPKWIPPGQAFWAETTGIFHLLAGMSILSGVLDLLAARLLTGMIISFGVLVWLPQLFMHPRDHTTWAGNAVNLALAGSAWVLADYIATRKEPIEVQRDPMPEPATHASSRAST